MRELPIRVGNDVVRLDDPRKVGKSQDERFVKRILTAEERAEVRAAPDADLELWYHWAAKEVGFKVVSKLLGTPPPFEHIAFVARWSGAPTADTGAGGAWRSGVVDYLDVSIRVRARHDTARLHAIGWGGHDAPARESEVQQGIESISPDGPWGAEREALEQRLTPRERDAVHSRESAAVRLAAREALAHALAVEERRVEIVCAPGVTGRRPPYVLLDGEPAAADVSLAHDGAWLAWAYWTVSSR